MSEFLVPAESRWELRKPTESKAEPLWKDLRAIFWTNIVAVVPMLIFAAAGLSIASLGAGAP